MFFNPALAMGWPQQVPMNPPSNPEQNQASSFNPTNVIPTTQPNSTSSREPNGMFLYYLAILDPFKSLNPMNNFSSSE